MSLFDTLTKAEDDSPIWVEAAEGFHKAKERLAELRSGTSGEYGVYDADTGVWVIPFDSHVPSERHPEPEQASEWMLPDRSFPCT